MTCGSAARCAVRLCLTDMVTFNEIFLGSRHSLEPRKKDSARVSRKGKPFRTSSGRAAIQYRTRTR